MPEPNIAVRHEPDKLRFVADIDGKESDAVLKYRPIGDGTLDYYSTFTPTELRGFGIAGRIVTKALDYALAEHLSVVPSCPYVAKLIERNEKYRQLVD